MKLPFLNRQPTYYKEEQPCRATDVVAWPFPHLITGTVNSLSILIVCQPRLAFHSVIPTSELP